jgi:hypothetical protein
MVARRGITAMRLLGVTRNSRRRRSASTTKATIATSQVNAVKVACAWQIIAAIAMLVEQMTCSAELVASAVHAEKEGLRRGVGIARNVMSKL